MCFGVLLIRVVIAVIFYVLKNKKASGCKSKVGTILGTAGSILVLALSLIPSFLFTGYEGLETTGTYQVKEVSAILVDESRTECSCYECTEYKTKYKVKYWLIFDITIKIGFFNHLI